MYGMPESLALLRPDDLFAAWCLVDSLEQAGEMAVEDAVRWKHGSDDEGKALRIVLDYMEEEADQSTVFEEVRCNHCGSVPNQD